MYRMTLVVIALLATNVSADDWLQFRGEGGAGVSDETGLPVTWSSTDNIVWRSELPGPGASSPIVVGKRVYVTCYTGYGLEPGKGDMNNLLRHLVCINRVNGKVLWTKDFQPLFPESAYGPGGNESQHGYSSSTPVSDGERLYVFFGKSGVYCLDLEGNDIWQASVGNLTNGWGSANSPLLFKDLVIVNASIESNSLVALDKNSGKEIWRTEKINSSWNTPVLVDAPNGSTELVVNEDQAVIGFDPVNGKELWRVGGFGGFVCPSVVADHGVVYVVRPGGGNRVLAIKAGGRGDVAESHVLWRAKGSSFVSSPVCSGGRLYWVSGPIHCLDAATGKDAIQPSRISAGGYASPLLADGKIYVVSVVGGGCVVDAATLQELSHNSIADDTSRVNASPIAHEGCILLRSDRYLYCIGKE